ncbi:MULTISPECIES: hypothetical protein [Chromobacterium]|uniref:Lipoprotein n=1 Tax=Chromobacterium aquaticum TaxID=467180 RepID=A0ABV8ZYK4_9NEIS|nr:MULTISPECIES: hypothetical protein [Chromobacterium]MCD5360499.1 hypothetical protein [Chromobacterium aquaticum]
MMSISRIVSRFGILSAVLIVTGCALNGPLEPEAIRAAMKATYQCHSSPIEKVGQGEQGVNKGCYFVLHSPETGRVLKNTPYLLQVHDPKSSGEAPAISLQGRTDGQGRSQFVSPPFDIDVNAVRFVEVVGSGNYRGNFTLVSRSGKPSSGAGYKLLACGKEVYKSRADYHGETVVYQTQDRCDFSMQLTR